MITWQMISNLRDMNATQINLNLYFSLNTDWNKRVHGCVEEWAADIDSGVKWVKKVIRKGIASGHYACDPQDPNALLFNITSTSADYNKYETKYCKHYSFLYSDAFRNLPVNAMRILLIAAYELSVQANHKNKPQNVVRLRKDAVKELLPVDEVKLSKALADLQKAAGIPVQLSFYQKKDHKGATHEFIEFIFEEDALNSVYHNNVEKNLLQWAAFEHHMDGVLQDAHYDAILRVAKYLFNLMGSAHRSLARKLYQESLEVLFSQLRKMDLMGPEQLSAYYRGIVLQYVQEPLQEALVETAIEWAETENLAEVLKSTHVELQEKGVAVEEWEGYQPDLLSLPEVQEKRERYNQLIVTSQDWVRARIQSAITRMDGQKDYEIGSQITQLMQQFAQSLKGKIDSRIDRRFVVNPRVLVRHVERVTGELYDQFVRFLDQTMREICPTIQAA